MRKSELKALYPEEYRILKTKWSSMKTRCANPNSRNYPNYGGRGIVVCDEWDKFINFFNWSMNNGFKPGLSIDRIDTNKNYSPDNCRYIALDEQQQNRRNNRHFIDPSDGEELCLAAIARKYNIPEETFRKRIDKYNMPLEKALTNKCRENSRWHIITDPLDGERLCLTDLAKKYNIKPITLSTRIHNGWDIKEAITKPVNKRTTRNNDAI